MSDSSYCAFLRGVNLGGRRLAMAEVCQGFRQAGVSAVSSILASGNICFESTEPPDDLAERLRQGLTAQFGFDLPLIIVSAEQLGRALANLPWPADAAVQRYLFFARPGVADALWRAWADVSPVELEAAALVDGQFYWRCAKGRTLDSGFSPILGAKRFRDTITSRNVNTVEKVAARLAI